MLEWLDTPWHALMVGAILMAGVISVVLIAASVVGSRIEIFPDIDEDW
jgi:hypothetical protein